MKTVPLVLVRVIQVKHRVYSAAQANSMRLLVPTNANHVQSQRILVKREETVVVFIVQWDGFLPRAVLNVKPVVRGRLATDANHAR